MDWQGFVNNIPKDFLWRSISGIASGTKTNMLYNQYANAVANGNMSATQMQQAMSGNDMEMSPDQEKHLDNLVAQENATTAYERDKEFAQNTRLWDAEQLGQLGLGASLSGNSYGGQNDAASTVMHNNAQARYERNLGIAKSMISLAGSLAGAGIHGDAIGMVRAAADKTALACAEIAAKVPKSFAEESFEHRGIHYRKREFF